MLLTTQQIYTIMCHDKISKFSGLEQKQYNGWLCSLRSKLTDYSCDMRNLAYLKIKLQQVNEKQVEQR